MKPAAQKVQEALLALGIDRTLIELPVSARTSREAAGALGVDVAQIAKSLVFTSNGTPVLAIASGANRVDERKLEQLTGGKIRKADAETVKQATGFAIGGVPPLAHATPLPTYIDRDLLQHEVIYPAGGVPECVFPISPQELLRATSGQVVDIRQEHGGQP
ncbi:MAG: YbaK/prolyl-tRNA synthetase associated region [Candidatus Rokubacteria bacterium CSP1-6]|jgi:prolyl-tRNA editing enzyme YbaK/EbsC (Cys-tRNA(Pro) deacylase)|nr:MAG: YbaK/prolyl-tRNA synthetase associated region [Candidatus Rokubacteria bacterium CSP1-6]